MAAKSKSPLTVKRVALLLLVAGLAYAGQKMGLLPTKEATATPSKQEAPRDQQRTSAPAPKADRAPSTETDRGDRDAGAERIAAAFRDETSGFMVRVAGSVDRTLPDDNEGSRHQRFIVKLSDGKTVLVAHNIDLAPRAPLERGDPVEVYGQYEWNDRGGVLHWTHRDPDGYHDEGWILHDGQRYE